MRDDNEFFQRLHKVFGVNRLIRSDAYYKEVWHNDYSCLNSLVLLVLFRLIGFLELVNRDSDPFIECSFFKLYLCSVNFRDEDFLIVLCCQIKSRCA